MIFTTYEKGDFDALYDQLLAICQRAQTCHYLEQKADFATDFYDRRSSFLHKLYVSKEIEFLSCMYINKNDLIAVSGITYQDKETARFAEYYYTIPKYRSNFTSVDFFLPQIKLISELGFTKAICLHKVYKQVIKKYFTKMKKLAALENLVILEPDFYGVCLNGKREPDTDYKETIHSTWQI